MKLSSIASFISSTLLEYTNVFFCRIQNTDTRYRTSLRQTVVWYCRNNIPLTLCARLCLLFVGLPTHVFLAEYIIVITGRELLGRLLDHDIYRATSFDILPVNPNISAHSPPHPVETHLLALVRSHLHEGNFLFSYEWDLTRRLQSQWETREKDGQKAFWETVSVDY